MEVQRYIAAPMRCNTWDCATCRKIKAEGYRSRMKLLWTRPKLFFLTLTYFHSEGPAKTWATYNEAWNRLRTNLTKQFGSFNYVRILESHKNAPYPHLHLITDKRFPTNVLGPAAVKAGFGYQIKQKPISTDGAILYLTKYLTKEWSNEEGWHLRKVYRCRIISFSRGLLSPKQDRGDWDSLLVGGGFKECLERIANDIEWNVNCIPHVNSEVSRDDFYEVAIAWADRDPTMLVRPADDWEPDGWIPH